MMITLFEWLDEKMGSKPLRNNRNLQFRADPLLPISQPVDHTVFMTISPKLVVRHNKQAKRLALRVDSHKQVVNLVIPKRTSLRTAYQFAFEHKNWIKEKLAALPMPIPLQHGTVIPLLGRTITIEVIYNSTSKRTSISLINNKLIVKTNKDDPSTRIQRYLKNLALKTFTALAEEKAAQIGQKIAKIEIKDTSSRWGSCSHDKKISFSWRLIFAPCDAMDYVIAHEVAHLKIMDHSPAFWTLCEKLSEDYSTGKSWMKRHGHDLMRYR